MPTALIAALTAAVVAIAALVLAAGPAASAAREYVARLAATDSTDSTHAPQIRRPWLLERRFQALIALALMGPILWRGVDRALADTLVALPLVAVLGVACCVDAVSHRLPNRLLGWAALWLIAATGLLSEPRCSRRPLEERRHPGRPEHSEHCGPWAALHSPRSESG